MPASVSTPSTSTHSRRTLRARSDTVTALHLELPFERLNWQHGIRLDLDGRDATDQLREVIGRNPVPWTLGDQHVRAKDGTRWNGFGGDDALAQSRANG